MDNNEKIRVLHIITRLDHGGSATNTIETVCRLDKRTYQVDLISGRTYDPGGEIRETLRRKNIRVTFIDALRREIHPWFDALAFLRLYRAIKKGNYAGVHTHSSKAGILGRWAAALAGVKAVVHTPHGHVFHGYAGPFLTKIFILLERITARRTDRIISQTSRGTEDHVRLKVAPREKFVVISSGIEFRNFDRAAVPGKARARYGVPKDIFLFGSVTRLEPIKGTDLLISAMAGVSRQYPQAKLMIVGEGSQETKLKERCQSLNISDKVIFTGYQKNVCEFLHMMDVFVLSSLNEGMPRAVAEALVCGKPVIASRTGGIPELIEDGQNGVLVPPGDARALAAAMAGFISVPGKAAALGQKGRDRVLDRCQADYSLENMILRIEQLYAELMGLVPVKEEILLGNHLNANLRESNANGRKFSRRDNSRKSASACQQAG